MGGGLHISKTVLAGPLLPWGVGSLVAGALPAHSHPHVATIYISERTPLLSLRNDRLPVRPYSAGLLPGGGSLGSHWAFHLNMQVAGFSLFGSLTICGHPLHLGEHTSCLQKMTDCQSVSMLYIYMPDLAWLVRMPL